MPTSLPPSIEANLAQWVVERSCSPVPLSKADVRREARIRYARFKKMPRSEVPEFSPSWVRGFCQRHPETDGCWGRGSRQMWIVPAGATPHVLKDGRVEMVYKQPKPRRILSESDTNSSR
ncbi:unnamed protein product [Sympodiomycopsis kandeliae]